MIVNYAAFAQETNWGDLQTLRASLDTVWDACIRGTALDVNVEILLARCDMAAPASEDFESLYVTSAQDAAFSVCALLEFLHSQSIKHIVSVLRFSIDTIDLIVQERESMDPRDPERERRILKHPLMQQELARQRRDLAEACRLTSDAVDDLSAFRRRASTEHNLALGDSG